jgi:hypothetical protein
MIAYKKPPKHGSFKLNILKCRGGEISVKNDAAFGGESV